MVERRVCTFCGDEIEPGTGRMYIKKDGVIYHFCTSKCYKNLVLLGRVPRRTTWTRYYEREKQVRMKGLPQIEEAPKARKLKKAEVEAKEEPKAEPAEKEEVEEPKPKAAPAKKAPPKAEKKAATKKVKPKAEPEEKPAEAEKE